MFIRVASVFLIMVTGGCVSTKVVPLPDTETENFRGKTLTYVVREKPAFSAMTAGKAAAGGLFGAIGGAAAGGAMVSAGNKIVQENEVADPAGHIEQALGDELKVARGVVIQDSGGIVAKTDEPLELAKLYPGVDLLLDVQTFNWGFLYFPTNWSHYHVMYGARLKLLNSADGRVLAVGTCVRGPEKKIDGAPTYEELLADHAARLKAEIDGAAEACVAEFRSKVLKL